MYLISVIVTTYNNADYIIEALNSVLYQNYENYEILVVDDGSTDSTKDIITDYINSNKIKYFYKKNEGPGAARNFGINHAAGEYIAFLDADDSLTQDSLEGRIKLASRNPTLEIVFSNYYVCSTSDAIYPAINRDSLRECNRYIRETDDGSIIQGSFPDIFEIPFLFWTGSVLIKKSLLERTGPFRTDIFIGEDREMWIRLMENTSAAGYVDRPLAYYKRFRGVLTKRDPIQYAMIRIKNNYSLLDIYSAKYNNHKNIEKVINDKLSWIYYDIGIIHHNNKRNARRFYNMMKSIYFNPKNRVAYRHIMYSFIPAILKEQFKKRLRTN